MKLRDSIFFFIISFYPLMSVTFDISANTSVSSEDQWTSFCLTTQDAGKATDECLNLGGILNTRFQLNNGFKILSPEVSQNLEISLAPTSKPTPLIFGHYWKCVVHKESNFETCKPVLVVCTDDQSLCAETP